MSTLRTRRSDRCHYDEFNDGFLSTESNELQASGNLFFDRSQLAPALLLLRRADTTVVMCGCTATSFFGVTLHALARFQGDVLPRQSQLQATAAIL